VFDLDMRSGGARGAGNLSIAIVRRSGQLDPSQPLANQIFVCQVNDSSPLGQFVQVCFRLLVFLFSLQFHFSFLDLIRRHDVVVRSPLLFAGEPIAAERRPESRGAKRRHCHWFAFLLQFLIRKWDSFRFIITAIHHQVWSVR
jgi:hypothetical protein